MAGAPGCATPSAPSPQVVAAQPTPAAPAPAATWDDFWRAHGVSPAPPRDFLDSPEAPPPELLNLTDGAVTDETVNRWVAADIRRGRGDGWAQTHLRLDVANADVLGPPGLNGTGASIEKLRATGLVEIVPRSRSVVVAAAVVAISKDLQRQSPRTGLTDFVVVQVFRSGEGGAERVFADGRREVIPPRKPAGQLSWQLDTGEFRDNAAVGPLWYQARGYSCHPGGPYATDQICGLVHPTQSIPASYQLPASEVEAP